MHATTNTLGTSPRDDKTDAPIGASVDAQTEAQTGAQTGAQTEAQTGAQIIIRSLIAHGVDVVFGYPGGQVLDIYDELYQHADQIRHVITAHEQGAAHAADGYARATGKVGVVIATSGPGATNLVTGIATAHLDSIPLVAITGNVTTKLLGKDSFQETDIFGITIPVTKHNYIVKDIKALPHILAEAFAIAQSGRPGPVLIDVPRDVQTARCESAIVKPYTLHADTPPQEQDGLAQDSTSVVSKEALAKKAHAKEVLTKEALARAVELITASERPYIYCGGGVLSAAAGLEVAQFAEHIDAVIGCSIMGLTAIPASHPRNLGMTGMHGREASIRAQDSADLIIAIGARFSDRATGNKAHYIADKKFLHLDIDAAEIDKNVSTSASLIGDIAPLLQALTAKLQPTKRVAWQEEIAAIVLEANAEEAPDDALSASDGLSTADTFDAPLDTPLDAKSIIRAVRKRSADDTIIVTDVGQHQMWVAQNYSFENPRTFLTSGGLGTMGFGMGAAIGACLGSSLANNTAPRKTVLFTGDGSFGMNLNEMATAVSQSLPLVIIIMNNGVLGMVRQWQALFYDERYSSTTLDRTTDFVALARAFGAEGCRVESRAELDTALDTAFAASGPFVVDCAIEKDEQVFPMIPPGGTIDNMLLG